MQAAYKQGELQDAEKRHKENIERQRQEIANKKKVAESITLIKNKFPPPKFYTTGFNNLDKRLFRGLREGTLHVIAADPVQDAYSLLLSIMNAQTSAHSACVYISQSRTQDEMQRSLVTNKAGVSLSDLDHPENLSDQKSLQLAEAINQYTGIILESRMNASMDVLEQVIEHHYLQGVRLFFLDALQYIRIGEMDKPFVANPENIFSANCRRIVEFIKGKSMTLVAVSLLNNNIDRRDADARYKNKDLRIPRLSDLRDSNVLKTLPYNVIFLHRPEFYDQSNNKLQAVTVYVAINGNRTNIGSCKLVYDQESGCHTDDNMRGGLFTQNGSRMSDMDFDIDHDDAPF